MSILYKNNLTSEVILLPWELFFGVLMSNDGLDKNVIKIKPPMIFSIDDSKKLILLLDKVLGEDYMISN